MLIYKGFIGQIDYDNESMKLVGQVVNSIDLLEFEGRSAAEIKCNFQSCIDEYLSFQKEYVHSKTIPFVGNFSICLSTDKQNQVIRAAQDEGESISQWLNKRVDSDLSRYFDKIA